MKAALAVIALAACSPRPSDRPSPVGDAPSLDTATTTPAETAAAANTLRPGPPARDSTPSASPYPSLDPLGKQVVTVADVLDDGRPVGKHVQVMGDCLRQGVALAEGPPPVTRSDWELGAGKRAVWVTGPRPAGCSMATARAGVVIWAQVLADTGKRLDGSVRVRRYLAILQP
jgi:hypothetical protein